jgi:hypothetical protein
MRIVTWGRINFAAATFQKGGQDGRLRALQDAPRMGDVSIEKR